MFVRYGEANTTTACTNWNAAKEFGFRGAMEYMPVPEPYSEKDTDYFDWKSVMLYGSNIGGHNVWTRASDGATIPSNKVPSTRDVARFREMYPDEAPRPTPCLVNQDCSPMKAMFYNTVAACMGDRVPSEDTGERNASPF